MKTLLVASLAYSLILVNPRTPERPFLVNIPQSNSYGIQSLESYLAQDGSVEVDQDGNPVMGVMIGDLMHTSPSPSHPWSFNLRDVSFADQTVEVCDGQFTDIENDPDYWFQNVGYFCPWSTRYMIQKIYRKNKLIYKREATSRLP